MEPRQYLLKVMEKQIQALRPQSEPWGLNMLIDV